MLPILGHEPYATTAKPNAMLLRSLATVYMNYTKATGELAVGNRVHPSTT